MALYRYDALNNRGEKIRGQLDASSPEAVKEQLRASGLYPITVTAAMQAEATTFSLASLWTPAVKPKELILFTKQLTVLLKSGVPLLQALELLVQQLDGSMKTVTVQLKDGVKEGRSLAAGMAQYPAVFDKIYIALVRAGEATGKLEMILERLTAYLERQQEITDRINSATRQPKIQLFFVGLITIFLVVKVVPQIVTVFARSGTTLPLPTQILLTISTIILSYYWLVIPCCIGIYLAWRYYAATATGALMIDTIKLRLPLVGYYTRINTVVQFCNTLGMLLESGVILSDALDIVVDIVDNRVLATVLSQARDKIIKEGRLSQYLQQTKLFPPIAIYLINTGEQSGRLDQMLLTVAGNYEKEMTEYVDELTARLNPIILLGTAVIVGFIVIAIILPMAQMSQAITGR
ncbi:type II secretion system F family protein [Candidatus Dependentiae bacterium]|nr:type II secretion system F family protein [Candidatus Dependentiae bacterium]